ncbi:MAG TPA: cysteine-rich CWC family protein [Pyrinomonadaceae bacterium]|nr:cysteine-rich CWC family protein [Pyrinomonadaceae bacterium]
MKSIELPQLVSTGSCAQSVCARCDEPFSCGAQSSACWCAEVKLTEETRATLREQYKSCLCRACLEQFAMDRL